MSKLKWRTLESCRQINDVILSPSWLLPRNRQIINDIVEVLTGHARLQRHLHLPFIGTSPFCQNCLAVEESVFRENFWFYNTLLKRNYTSQLGPGQFQEDWAGLDRSSGQFLTSCHYLKLTLPWTWFLNLKKCRQSLAFALYQINKITDSDTFPCILYVQLIWKLCISCFHRKNTWAAPLFGEEILRLPV